MSRSFGQAIGWRSSRLSGTSPIDFGIREMPVARPPPDEQAAIVRFLDWANGRLERAIRAKRKVIALLNEQKQAIIHRAVTRGLDPSVPLKPSGIPWLGDIPQHWEVRRLEVLRCDSTAAESIRGRADYRISTDAPIHIRAGSGCRSDQADSDSVAEPTRSDSSCDRRAILYVLRSTEAAHMASSGAMRRLAARIMIRYASSTPSRSCRLISRCALAHRSVHEASASRAQGMCRDAPSDLTLRSVRRCPMPFRQ